jgi:pyridoxamine 5'-phosphate oxidase
VDKSVADLRRNYSLRGLKETDLDPDPFKQFHSWFNDAINAMLLYPNAMILATATRDGKPSARPVLLKAFDERGFVFYTNYESRKGRELTENPLASVVFLWTELERQVCIEGSVEKCSTVESDTYFQSRPLVNRLVDVVSQQSQVISGREVLESRLEELMAEYADRDVPRPKYWGGYRLKPTSFEFWQQRPNRLHDRLHYSLIDDGSWRIERLSP